MAKLVRKQYLICTKKPAMMINRLGPAIFRPKINFIYEMMGDHYYLVGPQEYEFLTTDKNVLEEVDDIELVREYKFETNDPDLSEYL